MNNNSESNKWDLEIKSVSSLWRVDWKELWNYRDLLLLFIRRDIVTVYKQTILGPVWFILQPILTTIIFVVVFGNMAGLSTDGLPQPLFYLSGITMWGYFSESLTLTSKTFIDNAAIFGKVYFPRLILPISKVISGIMKFMVQLVLFLMVWGYFYISTDILQPNLWILTLPLIILLMGGLGLGFGILISSFTTKYRDLTFLVGFGIQLAMYATPVILPVSSIENETYKTLIMLNPVSSLIELFRYSFTGAGTVSFVSILYTVVFTVVLLLTSIFIFNKVEKNFIDTV